MANKKTAQFFKWLATDQDWSGGRLHLVTNATYEARLVEADVLAVWIAAGVAQMVGAEEK